MPTHSVREFGIFQRGAKSVEIIKDLATGTKEKDRFRRDPNDGMENAVNVLKRTDHAADA